MLGAVVRCSAPEDCFLSERLERSSGFGLCGANFNATMLFWDVIIE